MAAARSFNRAARRLRVYVSDRINGFDCAWAERTDLVARVELTSGSTPARCLLASARDPDRTGPVFPPTLGRSAVAKLPNGEYGEQLVPFGLLPWTFVKVTCQGDELQTVFLGVVTGWRLNRQRARVEVVCQDYRVLMRRIRCRGSRWWRPVTGSEDFILDLGPHFNAGGVPDEYVSAVGVRDWTFITRGYNQADGSQVDGTKRFATFWRVGEALNCLRDYFVADPAGELQTAKDWLVWPQVTATTHPWLFVDPVTGKDRRVGDLDCAGRSLAWAVEQLLAAAGVGDWALRYVRSGDRDKAELVFYEIFGVMAKKKFYTELKMGEPGKRIDQAEPDVFDADLEVDYSEAFQQVRVVGARKSFDVSLDSHTAGTLEPMWSAAQKTAWDAMPTGTNAERAAKKAAYPDVLCAWCVPENINWTAFFGGGAGWREGDRESFAELASVSLKEAGAGDRPVRLRMIVWRSTDSGVSWEELPSDVPVTPLRNRVGFRLGVSAREIRSLLGGETGEPWSHCAGTEWYMRLTVRVEADERLVATYADAGTSWPDGEFYVPAGNRYRYDVRRSCFVHVDGVGYPVVQSSTVIEKGAASDEVIRNDTLAATAAARKRVLQLARPRVRGAVTLPILTPERFPGDLVSGLKGGGSPFDGLPDIALYMAVRGVVHDAESQTTVLRFEGL